MSYEQSSPSRQVLLFMYNADSSRLGWQYKYNCSSGCITSTSNTFISQESETIILATYDSDKPTIFEVSLTDGSLRSSILQSTETFAGISKPIMKQFGSSDTQVIVSYSYTSGSNMIIWSTKTSSVVSSHNKIFVDQKVHAIDGSQSNGMLYLASGDVNFLEIYKLYYYDPSMTSSIFSGSITLSALSTDSYVVATSVSLSAESTPTLSAVSVTTSDNTTIPNKNQTNDIVYVNGRDQFHSLSSGYSGNLSFEYFCSKSGTTSLTPSIYNVNNSVTSWISVDSSYTYLTVNAPTVTTATNYSYGISYILGDFNITSQNILGIHLCSVKNCISCEYSTRDTACTTCDSGYFLSSDGTS